MNHSQGAAKIKAVYRASKIIRFALTAIGNTGALREG